MTVDSRARPPAGPDGLARGRALVGGPVGAAVWLVLGAFLVGLARHGDGFEVLVDGWLGALVMVLPALACWLAVPGAGARRPEVLCLALGSSSFAAGNVVFVVAASTGAELPFPSGGDLGFICFYPLALAAVVLAVRRELQSVQGSVWLDSLLGGLGAAAVLSVLLEPVFAQANGGALEVVATLAYPLFDLALVGTVVGVAALQGPQAYGRWLPLLTGLASFCAADVQYALRVTSDSYVVGTPLDALWAVGLTLLWVWARASPVAAPPVAEERMVALAVPVLATASSLAVLAVATRVELSALAVSLSILTLLATAGRTQLAFRQLRRLADLRRQATTDDLTGLPNRRAFYAHVTETLQRAAAPAVTHALLLMDLDKFKEVNDSLGHHTGDQLLVQVGERLGDELRSGDVLARLGGDEFAVLLSGTTSKEALAVAAKLREALAEPFLLDGLALRTDMSIGLALSPEHGSDMTVLLRRADIAMYKAKHAREGQRLYASADDIRGDDRLRTIDELHAALAGQELVLHYQPKVTLADGAVHGVEALVRWEHPARGLLPPATFLPLAEDAGLMRRLTRVVLEQALDQARAWREAGRPLTVAVNLSASSLVDTDLPEQVAALLAARGLPAGALQLEITEEFLMADHSRARLVLRRLRDQGIQIAVDDFGTGYSSLAYLRELPIDELKLDRSFVFPMADDARAVALVVSTISLAHSLGLRMVAEGVEDAAALQELTRHGCDQAQGYHLSPALPAAELDRWLDRRPLPVPSSAVPSSAVPSSAVPSSAVPS